MPEELWARFREQNQRLGHLRPPHVAPSAGCGLSPQRASAVSTWFAQWVRTVEQVVSAHRQQPPSGGPSRAEGCRFSEEPVRHSGRQRELPLRGR
eukprot:131264-Pyramimonas_sp.AAC.1